VKRGIEPAFIAWRFHLLLIFVLLIVAGLFLRVIDLTFFKRHFLRQQGNERVVRNLTLPAFRGMIKDRHGYPLAVSTSIYSVWVNPKEFVINAENLNRLSQKIGLKAKTIQTQIEKYQKKGRVFVYLKRDLIPDVAEKIKALKLPGVYLQQGFKRYYPEGEVAAHVIGFTNVDDQGQEGLELLYDQWLSGSPGKKRVIKDRLGRVIGELQTLQEQKPGHDLTLSIDHHIQYLAYRELMAGIRKNSADSGSAIVLDAKTGEVLAMVNQPSFNPNQSEGLNRDAMRNRAVTDVFEPGSVIKAFSVSAALESGLYQPQTVINTYPGWLRVGHNIVRDEHSKGPMTVAEILQISSNVGVTKMVLSLPPNDLWRFYSRMGFGEITGIGFPGERAGVLVNHPGPFAMATLGYGYGLSVTALQLIDAYNVLANDGEKKPLSLLKLDHAPAGTQVMKPEIAQKMLTLLESVVTAKKGTGVLAQVPGYRIAGKTGTAKKIGQNGYEKRYISSFVGIAPASDPRLVVIVVVNNLRGKTYYAGDVAAPIFKSITEGALRILNVKPDNVGSL